MMDDSTNESVRLREAFQAALEPEPELSQLLSIVSQFKAKGLSQDDTYQTLHTLYVELGCSGDRYDKDPEFCDRIGDVLDNVWGGPGCIWPNNMGDDTSK